MNTIIIVLISVIIAAFGQIYFKQGINKLGKVGFSQIIKNLINLFKDKYILLGLFLYGLSSALWLFALTRLDISKVYPLTSLGYLVTAIFAKRYLKEDVNSFRWIGIALIILGSTLIIIGV